MRLRTILTVGLYSICSVACMTYQRGKGTLKAESQPGEYRVYANEIFANPDQTKLAADIYVPDLPPPLLGFPTVILIHGGGWQSGSKEQMTPIAQRLVRAGFGVMNISYRFSPKYRWPAAFDDCQEALLWLRQNSSRFNFDSQKIATFGYSAGGHLALMMAYKGQRTDRADLTIQAVVNGAGPVDFRDFPESPLVRQLMGDSIERIPDAYKDASPYYAITKDSPPTFVYYGENDWIVDANQSRKLLEKLKAKNIEHDSYEAYFGHIATFLFDEKETELATAFLKKVLKVGM